MNDDTVEDAIAECHRRGWGVSLFHPPGARPAAKLWGNRIYVECGDTLAEAVRRALATANQADAPMTRAGS